MSELVTYEQKGSLAWISLDDGKANVMGLQMLQEINGALDKAEESASAVVLTGRPGIFSGGFDLKLLQSGRFEALKMLRGGFELSARLLAFPQPTLIACSGHAIAMGAFLVLSADYRIGVSGDFTLRANEVAIGLTMPRAALEICRQRLAPAHYVRAALLSESYGPEQAVAAGFLDRVVAPEDLSQVALEHAKTFEELDPKAHAASKQRLQAEVLRNLHRGISADMREITMLGAKRLLSKWVSGGRKNGRKDA